MCLLDACVRDDTVGIIYCHGCLFGKLRNGLAEVNILVLTVPDQALISYVYVYVYIIIIIIIIINHHCLVQVPIHVQDLMLILTSLEER